MQMMKDVCKKPTQFRIIRVLRFEISNPDSVGVKFKISHEFSTSTTNERS